MSLKSTIAVQRLLKEYCAGPGCRLEEGTLAFQETRVAIPAKSAPSQPPKAMPQGDLVTLLCVCW